MDYDVIIIGGGLAGATLAKRLVEQDASVLVIERESVFRDRVRGEQMHCWGAVEARRNGVYDLLVECGGHELSCVTVQPKGAPPMPARNVIETTPAGVPLLNVYHPAMQAKLLAAAEAAGAVVQRGASVTAIQPGSSPRVEVRERRGSRRTYDGRLVIGADGRDSACRRWGKFTVRPDPDVTKIAGVLLEGCSAPDDTLWLHIDSTYARVSLIAPLGGGRVRAYVGTNVASPVAQHVFTGERDLSAFIAASVDMGAPALWFERVRMAGPLATFEGADRWVDHPYQDGVVLVGDAAGSSDPSFGCGMSLTLRDVRVLADGLAVNSDWKAAADAYATEHDKYFGAIHRTTAWVRSVVYDPGPEGIARRRRAMPRWAEDPTRVFDIVGQGPEFPSDESARRRYFGED